MQEYTLLSIITPVYNRVDFIEKAIRSVQNQDYPSVEHLIIDGGSDDGTHEILTRYPHIKLTSEPDKGVFDAMNKGIQRARGEILGFLNSDDVYEPYIFNEVMRVFKDNPEVMAINGGAKVVRETMTENTMDSRYFPPISTDDIYERTTLGSPIFKIGRAHV